MIVARLNYLVLVLGKYQPVFFVELFVIFVVVIVVVLPSGVNYSILYGQVMFVWCKYLRMSIF